MQREKMGRIDIRPATWVLLCLLLYLILSPPLVSASAPAGRVSFVSGVAMLERDTQQRALTADTTIHEGDRLETGVDGYVHLRMVDGAVISLRSESALSIVHYRFTPQAPSASRANLALHYGVARSISGEIGARSKERFRLDTPIAAIGIRGTDFSVLSTNKVSRLSVKRGGVVMAPLSAACHQGGVGPCAGPGAAELFESQRDLLLEIRQGDAAARLTQEGITPNEFRPPHPAESTLNGVQAPATVQQGDWLVTGDSLPGASNYEEALEQAEHYMAQTGLITEAVERGNAASEIQPRDRGLVETPTIMWGRWSDHNEGYAAEISRLLHGGESSRQYANVGNSVFGLVETATPERQLPDRGKAYFNLNSYEAYIKRNSELETASISHPGLVVDFEQQRFAARLDVHAESLPGKVHVVGGGSLSNAGYLRSDKLSPSAMAGALSGAADEAGLLFEYQIEPGVDAVGATHWALERD